MIGQLAAGPVRAAGLSFVINLGLSLILMNWLSTVGLALAGNVAVLAQAWFLQTRLSRRMAELSFAPLLPNLGKITVASALMGLVVWGGAKLAASLPLTGKAQDLIVVVGLIPAACVVYGALLWALKVEGREELGALWSRFRNRGDAA